MGWKFIFQAVVEIRTGRPLQEHCGFCEIGGGRWLLITRGHTSKCSRVTAYVEHAIARCSAPTQQLFNNQVHDDHDVTMMTMTTTMKRVGKKKKGEKKKKCEKKKKGKKKRKRVPRTVMCDFPPTSSSFLPAN